MGAPRIDRIESLASNWIINGDMRLSQRGDFTSASAAAHDTYYLDRWKTTIGSITANKQHISTSQPAALVGSKSSKYIATSSATGYLSVLQVIEDSSIILVGKTLYCSAWVKSNNSNARIWASGATQLSATTHTGDGTWQLLKASFAVTGSVQFNVALIGAGASMISITSGDYIEFTGALCVLGDYGTFYPRDLGTELRLAQRYYEQIKSYYLASAGGNGVDSGSNVNFQVTKRATPVISLSNASFAYNNSSGAYSGSPNVNGFTISATRGSETVNGKFIQLSSGYISADAEF